MFRKNKQEAMMMPDNKIRLTETVHGGG